MASKKYTHAVVCRIPQSYRTKCDIELDEAKRQHEALVKQLRELGLDVIELPPDENFPECIFVEDTAVVCNEIALITRPGVQSRSGEVGTMRSVLKKELDLPIIEIEDENAKLDGGDVLFTGREFFVGISGRSNEAGARAVAAAFPEYPCTAVRVTERLHLKNLVSVAGPDLLCVASTKPAQDLLKLTVPSHSYETENPIIRGGTNYEGHCAITVMSHKAPGIWVNYIAREGSVEASSAVFLKPERIGREATYKYQTLTVPEEDAASVLYVNGTLIHRSEDEIPESYKVFTKRVDFPRRSVSVSELTKTGQGLSSCCLLLRLSDHIGCL